MASSSRAIQPTRPPGRPRHLRTLTLLTASSQGEAVLSMISLMLLVRLEGAERAGQLIFAQAFAAVWFLVCDPRLEDAAQRFVPIEHQRSGQGAALYVRLLRWDVAIGVATSLTALLVVLGAWMTGLASGDFALMLGLALVANGAVASSGTSSAGFALTDRLDALGAARLRCAVLSFVLSLGGLLLGGPPAYLAGQAVAAIVTALVLGTRSLRAMLAEMGPAQSRVPLPPGLVPFAVKASLATSVAAGSESGILTLAGLLGGPALVTILKIASAPGRLYYSLISPITSMLYPRLAQAAAAGETALIRRDAVRVTLALTGLGAAALTIAAPTADDALGLVYGTRYAEVGTVATLLLAAFCVKGMACWSKVLPLALGKPSWRLAFLAAEGVLLLGALLLADRTGAAPLGTAVAFAQGNLIIAICGTTFWIVMLGRCSRSRC
ncbi:hypothetical protein GCM10022226_17770 [Sphaerisporangium flaviroseum]|uniref:Polysaccharide biosynthesis protein n=1 Tax=Sphaerisporangium flaviroseum TaxID=509199 RepID=A0ABP7HND9_9ACTN